MNKELFVSSTPHETKVGLVEDDLLAEIYMERENEYTLAGSIYKGRVTRVLPGMQSAFVDIGLERDAFLYVSDFMDLEEHDDDLTDVVPANRGVQDMRPQATRQEGADAVEPVEAASVETESAEAEAVSGEGDAEGEPQAANADGESAESGNGSESGRDRGQWRGRRRRRGGRRERGPERGVERTERPDRGDRGERSSEPRFSRPPEVASSRPSGPPAGYTPILLPGESISKYSRYSSQAPVQTAVASESVENAAEAASEASAPVAATFPEDEPIFAAGEASAEPLHELHEDTHSVTEEAVESAATSANWNREFRRPEEVSAPVAEWPVAEPVATAQPEVVEPRYEESVEEVQEESEFAPEAVSSEEHQHESHEDEVPMFAAPGTMEEETIDEEEADAIRFESSSDEGYEEFEEETRAADHLNG